MSDISDRHVLPPGLVRVRDNISGRVEVVTQERAQGIVRGRTGSILADNELVLPTGASPYEQARSGATYHRVFSAVPREDLNRASARASRDFPTVNVSTADLVATLLTAYGRGRIQLLTITPLVEAGKAR